MKKNLETIMQPSFVFSDGIQKCIEDGNLESEVYVGDEKTYLETSQKKTFKFGQSLLFNQTKIFYGGEEIGYYNKSSFCVYATLPRSVKNILKARGFMTFVLI